MRSPVLVVAVAVAFARVAATECESERAPTHLGERYNDGRTYTATKVVSKSGASHMRVRLRIEHTVGSRWTLSVSDHAMRPYQVISDVDAAARSEFWTTRVNGSEVWFALQTRSGVAPRITYVEYIAMPEKAEHPYYSLLFAQERFVDLYSSADPSARPLGDHVGMLTASWANASWCCSAVAIGSDLVLTNWHCGGLQQDAGLASVPEEAYWSSIICRDTVIDFSWDDDRTSREFQCTEVVASDRRRDFAILRVIPLNGTGALKPATISLAGNPTGGRLIHHPACRRKQLSSGCAATLHTETAMASPWKVRRLAHTCDSEGGSSGGGLFDSAGMLIGLHHHGFDRMADCTPTDHVNKAVDVREIVQYLGTCHAVLAAELFLSGGTVAAADGGIVCPSP